MQDSPLTPGFTRNIYSYPIKLPLISGAGWLHSLEAPELLRHGRYNPDSILSTAISMFIMPLTAAAAGAAAGPVPSVNCSTPVLSGLLFYFLPALPFLFVPALSFSLLHYAPHSLIFRTLPISTNKVHLHTPRLTAAQIISSCLIMSYVSHSLRP